MRCRLLSWLALILSLEFTSGAWAQPSLRIGEINSYTGIAAGFTLPYRQAVEMVVQTQQASISMIQRRLRVGFNRAARMIERMEREGIVSAMDGTRPREVLVSRVES